MSKNPKKTKRNFIFILVAIISLSAVCLAFTAKSSDNEKSEKSSEKEIIVGKGNLIKTIETTGEIVPNREVEIKCKASGEITELPLDISDEVKAGDILLQLDPEDEETSVKQAKVSLAVSQSEYAQSKVNLKLAKLNLDVETMRTEAALKLANATKMEYTSKFNRAKTLNEKNVISDELYETANTAYVNVCISVNNVEADIKNLESLKMNIEIMENNTKIAEAKVESSQLSLIDAQQRLRDVTVTAPLDGVVSSQDVQIGQIIASGVNNVDGGTTIMTIADLSKTYVLASVDESDIGGIKKGQKAEITVDAYPNLSFPGRIMRIATTGKTVSSVVTFEVKLEIVGQNRELLKPGMTADIDIVVLEKKDVITLPIAAVSRKLKDQYVEIKDKEGNRVEHLVIVGDSGNGKIEIIEGVSVNDVVIVSEKSRSKWSNNNNGAQRISPGGAMGGMRI